jgi:hypothetical protein
VLLALACALVGGVVAGVVVAVVSGDDDGGGGGGADQTGAVTTTTGEPLDAEGQELVEILARSDELVYTASFSFMNAGPGGEQDLLLTVWRKGERNRQDLEGTSNGQPIHTSMFTEPQRSVACTVTAESTWQCQTVAETPPPLDQLIAGVRQELGGRDIVASDGEVGGTPARCFSLTEGDETAELCVREDGVPLRIESGAATLELQSFGESVDDSIFIPPADPSG